MFAQAAQLIDVGSVSPAQATAVGLLGALAAQDADRSDPTPASTDAYMGAFDWA